MTDLMLLVGIASLVPTIAALATFQQGQRIRKTANQIHTLTNSNLSKVLSDLALANDRIAKLEGLVATFAERNGAEKDEANQHAKEAKP